MLCIAFAAVPQESLVNQEAQQLYRRLRAVEFNGWHVDIVYENDVLVPGGCAKLILGFLLKLVFDGKLRDQR